MNSFQNVINTLPRDYPFIHRTVYYPEIGSTNDEAIKLGKAGTPAICLVVADTQKTGHGRLSRKWDSPTGKGLYFSLLIRPELPITHAPLLTLAVGLGIKKALAKWKLPPIMLKWPNDILVQRKKLGGVLTEMFSQGSRVDFVVIGIGLNVLMDPEDFSTEVSSLATSLKQILGKTLDREDVLKSILPEIQSEIETLVQKGPDFLIQRWEQESGMLGAKIQFSPDGEKKTGTVLGLASDGQLRIQCEDKTITQVIAGDITLCY